MTAPILRVGKMKSMGRSTAQSVQGHLARNCPTRNADSARTPRNVWLVGGPDQDLAASIHAVMGKAGIDPAKLRKDATIANDLLLSVSPEWFRPDNPAARGTWDEDRLEAFRKEADAFLRRFGSRLVTAVLHLDESTPHVQAVVVPIMRGKESGWRLSGKDMFNPDSLRTLQQAWEDRMAPYGVGQRIKGSTARHAPLRRFYAALDGFDAADPVPSIALTDPPLKGVLESSQGHAGRVAEWKQGEEQRVRKKLAPVSSAASRGRLYDAERRTADQLRGQVAERGQELRQAQQEVAQVKAELALTKDQVAALRQAPLNQVVAMLGHTGPVRPRENAIDVVKRVGMLNYADAIAWLAQRFDPQVAATAVREDAERVAKAAAVGPAVFTMAERTKRQLVTRQLDALAAPAYRITTQVVLDGKKVARNFGKAKVEGEPERTFTKDEVLDLIPRLTVENHAGRNVFITPLDPHAWHVLVDDVEAAGLRDLAERGYTPALTLETSPGNHQVVLKVPRDDTTPKDATNELFKDLNRDIGDNRITGLIHPTRLAGFENRKDKHKNSEGEYPWVGLVSAVNQMCRKTLEMVRAYASPLLSSIPSPTSPEAPPGP